MLLILNLIITFRGGVFWGEIRSEIRYLIETVNYGRRILLWLCKAIETIVCVKGSKQLYLFFSVPADDVSITLVNVEVN